MILAETKDRQAKNRSGGLWANDIDIAVKQKPLCLFFYFLYSLSKSDICLATIILFRYSQNIRTQDTFLKCYYLTLAVEINAGVDPGSADVGDFDFPWLVIFFGLVLLY